MAGMPGHAGEGGLLEEIRRDLRIQRVDGTRVLASRGDRLFRSEDGGETWEEDGRAVVGGWRKHLAAVPLLKDIARAGISFVLPLPGGGNLWVVAGLMLRAEAGSLEYSMTMRFPKGSRPLNVCHSTEGSLYWGEYFLNLQRKDPVDIYSSDDGGRTWRVAYTFPRGAVCHVHRVVHDPYDDAIWVCTGDRDEEAGIFRSTDGLRTLRRIVGGRQMYRTNSLICRESCILYGTDNPSGDNFVMALDRCTSRVERIQALPGPVIHGCEINGKVVFSTMVEKQNHEVTVWMGDENGFSLLAHLDARKRNRAWRELTGYPKVILPEGKGEVPALLLTPVGTKKFAGSLVRMRLDGGAPKGSDGP